MAGIRLILSDFIISFMWVWSGTLIKLFVIKILGLGFQPSGEIIKGSLSVLSMFFFAWLGKISRGGSYNPLTVLSGAISGNFTGFLFTVCVRIPAQVAGSIVAVKLIIETLPEIGHGPRLNVDIHRGALTEGLLTFTIVSLSCGLARSSPSSFFMKTWITSVSKLALHILGSDLTGGCMNPASAMGWAYAQGKHITKEHLFVYWLAPIEATLLGVWTFKLLAPPQKKEQDVSKSKSD
ncbi:Major intrinsic protein [Macleaya cordata]|uniref:Major intrinsic protein n=1 Tax=Macleaya cordata TaxID=56857 RepID=A0A200QTJ6_MACCD|nr:Major intrinsic protein [Macleaya cordata]